MLSLKMSEVPNLVVYADYNILLSCVYSGFRIFATHKCSLWSCLSLYLSV